MMHRRARRLRHLQKLDASTRLSLMWADGYATFLTLVQVYSIICCGTQKQAVSYA
jgi:hypothetical protein